MGVLGSGLTEDLAVQVGQGGKKRDRAVSLIVMRLSPTVAAHDGKTGLGPFQGLALALLITTQHQGAVRRIQIQANHVPEFLLEVLVRGELKRPRHMRLDGIRAPESLHRRLGYAGGLGHASHRPPRARRGRLGRPDDNLLPDARGNRVLASPALGLRQARDPGLPEPLLPLNHDGPADSQSLGGLGLTEPIRAMDNDPGPLMLPLRRRRPLHDRSQRTPLFWREAQWTDGAGHLHTLPLPIYYVKSIVRQYTSTYAMRRSLENRAKRLEDGLKQAQDLLRTAPPDLPDPEEIEEFEDAERERLERMLEAITLAGNAEQVREEIAELRQLAEEAKAVEGSGSETKLGHLRKIMQDEGFFHRPDQRLLLFTEFKDTLDYLMEQLKAWGFIVGCIHGGMKPGSRDEPGTRIYTEQQFREGAIQVLVATEAAGEGINLQCCHILFNYDIPWNPNRLEQRMGRIHRYGQRFDCLIFNFVATNTIEGRVLQRLLDKLQEIRDALDDDAVFNVVGEVLPSAHVERVLRDYYAGKLGDADLEERLLKDVDERHFRSICQTALEGLASKKLNLDMLTERRARAQERRVVPETIARFIKDCAQDAALDLKPVSSKAHTFEPGRTPPSLKKYEREPRWKLPELSIRYPRLSTDRTTAEENNLEWVTPGHPLFEALRRNSFDVGQDAFAKGACFHSLEHEKPARLDFYKAKVVDGLGHVIHEQLFTVELGDEGSPQLREPDLLGNLIPTTAPDVLPAVASLLEATAWLNEHALTPFIDEVRAERLAEVDRIEEHVNLSLTEVLHRIDQEIGRAAEEVHNDVTGSEGRLAQAETRHADMLARRERRREELKRQRAVTLQGVERLTSILILPHPERENLDVRRLRPSLETEMTAMRVVMEHEKAQGRQVYDVHEKNLGYDVKSLDLQSGELRLIEVKGLAAAIGSILLTPNERRLAEDRRDCYWLYVVTNCASAPDLETIRDPARFPWHEVTKVAHYYLSVDALKQPMEVREDEVHYGDEKNGL